MQKRAEHKKFIIFNYEDDTIDAGNTIQELIDSTFGDIDECYHELYREFYNSLDDLNDGIYEHSIVFGGKEVCFFIDITLKDY